MSSDIEVLEVRRIENAGNIRALATVRLGGITLIGCKVIREEGKRAWVAMPDRPWVADDWTKHWAEIVKLPTTLKRRVDNAVLATWESA